MEEQINLKPELVEEIRGLAKKYGVREVWLFDSRARGDHRPTSDIDLAISGGDRVRFAIDVDEETCTLLKFDVVDLDGPVQRELLESIQQEGVLLYEKL